MAATASMRLLTQGWSMDQRRALVRHLGPQEIKIVRDRIRHELSSGVLEQEDVDEAIQFLDSGGAIGLSLGIVEWAAAVLFGRDPQFVDAWRRIRRMESPA